jgi:hypothetical protein
MQNWSFAQRTARFFRDGKRVDAAQVQALVAAVEAPRILKPNMENLGITSA